MSENRSETLKGKVAVVTGAARGIGRAVAHRLASLGADIVLLDIDLTAAKAMDEELTQETVAAEIEAYGVSCLAIEADLTKPDDVARSFSSIGERFPGLDIVVNCAGGLVTATDRGSPSVVSPDDIDTLLSINLKTTINVCQNAIPLMKGREAGSIINISSLAGQLTASRGKNAGYGFSKAALDSYSRSLAAELGPEGIRVNTIAPGVITTSRIVKQAASRGIGNPSEAAHAPLRRLGTPEDIANVVEFFAGPLSSFITGETLTVCGGSKLSAGTTRS